MRFGADLRTWALIGAWTAMMSGCAMFRSPESPSPAVIDAARLAPLYALKKWRLEGRVGARAAHDGWNAYLVWEHEGKQDRLRVSGPFSQGAVSIVLQDDLLYLNDGSGRDELSQSPEEALKARLGFDIPLRELRYWVLGAPAPAKPYEAVAGGFRQEGWLLSYEAFERVGALSLPRKLSSENPRLKLKLIVDDWSATE